MPTATQMITLGHKPGDTQLTVAAAVISVERKEEPGLFGSARHGLYAHLEVTVPPDARPYSYFLSRLDGESDWVVDALFGSNGFPHFSHGFGARYLRLRGIAPELEDLLDQEALAKGLVQAIGRNLPLTLAGDVID